MAAARFQLLLLLAAAAMLCGGCGGPNYALSTVTGRVTIDGAAVPKGCITFSPTEGSRGPAVGAPIQDGEYRCEKVPRGKVCVTFIAQAAEPTKLYDKYRNMTHQVPTDILPPSCRQGQTAEITSPQQELNFDLKSSLPRR
jgi:hypothetical protein